jgi:predicted DNA-binding transcriptional regulator YafY
VRPLNARSPRPRTPRVGRPLGKFTQHRRIDRLRELLESEPRGLTLDELSRMLKVTERSVRRYLRELDGTKDKDKFVHLESIPTARGAAHLWRIKPGERGRAVLIRRAQAYALLSTRRALDVLKGSALYDEADLALGHIEKVAQTPFRTKGGEISGAEGLEARFFWNPPPARTYAGRSDDLDEVFRAVADLRVIRYRPRTRASEVKAERVVFHPHAMIIHDGSVVVLGVRSHRHMKDGPEVVPLEAMSDIRTSETEYFKLPEGFDVSEYVHGAFGLGRPLEAQAVVEFDARVAEDIRAKKWSRAQRIATSPDGRLRLTVPLVSVESFVSWVLSFGDAARVVEPPEVVAEIADVLARAARRYQS